LRSARQKLVGGFAARDREVIRRLRRRILVGQAASARIAKSFESDQGRHNEEIRSAFFNWRLLAVVYRDERGRSTSRVIEPHYLLLNAPAWYVLAWDRLRDAVRAFRTDRIVRAEVIEGRFGVRSAAPFMQAAEHVETL
jgi:predicted DNA-binding transcriptional regulator YafY